MKLKFCNALFLFFIIPLAIQSQSIIPGKVLVPPTGKTVTYYLNVADTIVNFTGSKQPALAVNGQIPAPTLRFNAGDSARMVVKNNTDETVSFHWHGLLLPNEFDGVPMLNTRLINPGDTYVFAFPIIQHGTYWYHSHTEFDEQKGQYGPIVIQPPQPLQGKEKVLLISDWTNHRPYEVLRQLKRHADWFALKRDAVMSYGKGIANGMIGTKLWLEWNRMADMDLADVFYDAFLANGKLDDHFSDIRSGEKVRLRIINGSASSHFWLQFAGGKMTVVSADGIDVEPVEVDKLLIATAETYDIEVTVPADGQYEFRATSWDRYKHTSLWIGNGKKLAAPDLPEVNYFQLADEMRQMMKMMPNMKMGKAPDNIPPVKVYDRGEAPDYQDMGMMQMNMNDPDHKDQKKENMPMEDHMHDKKMKMDSMDHKKPDDHTGHVMENLENTSNDEMESMKKGKTYKAEELAQHSMHMKENGPMNIMMTGYHQLKKQNPDEVIFDYNMLRSSIKTALPDTGKVRVIHLFLAGNMLRYNWTVNDLPLSKADKIMIRRGETVRFVMHNTTMMSHPMHLHGHFFRVINKHGEYSPLKHTVNVTAMEATTIEFLATEDKDWFFHCHLLYHMMSGMARVVGYHGSDVPLTHRDDYKKFALEDRMWFPQAEVFIASNSIFGDLGVFNYYNEINIEGDWDYKDLYEVEGKYMRYIGPKQFFAPYIGFETSQEEVDGVVNGGEQQFVDKTVGTLGFRYFLPMHIWSDFRIGTDGNFNVELEREDIPLTQRWRLGASVDYDFNEWEYRFNSTYIVWQYLALGAHYDSDYGWGGGIVIIY